MVRVLQKWSSAGLVQGLVVGSAVGSAVGPAVGSSVGSAVQKYKSLCDLPEKLTLFNKPLIHNNLFNSMKKYYRN